MWSVNGQRWFTKPRIITPEWERTLLWNDPALNIAWPIPAGEEPILSARDKQGVPLAQAEVYQQEIT